MVVGRNAALDRARTHRPTAPLDEHQGIPASEPGPEERAVHDDAGRAVRAALDRLEPGQREAIELAFFGGRSQTEIAHDTGVPLGTVKSRIRLAMQHLRRALGEPA